LRISIEAFDLEKPSNFKHSSIMTTLTLELDSALIHEIEDFARKESKTPNEWVAEHLKLATTAAKNGYPTGWINLFGSIPDSDGFEAPTRTKCREIEPLDVNP
jgi:hypothetical protein